MITLLTDFGASGPYVASMKGVILSHAPDARLVDISHDISPQNVDEAAYVLFRCYACFPEQTVHIVVVDPGVGSSRAILTVRAAGQIFLAPDNSVLKYIFNAHPDFKAYSVTNQSFFRQNVSRTFHGRDIFAPVAAHLELGEPVEAVGPAYRPAHPGRVFGPEKSGDRISGEIVYIDRFGNGVTNIPGEWMEGRRVQIVECGQVSLRKMSKTYADVEVGEPLALIGSMGTMELSVRCGSAKEQLALNVRDRISITLQ